jgi:hypothetical protein
MSSTDQQYFDPEHYLNVFSVHSRMHLFLITLFFARKKTTKECFLTIESLEKIGEEPSEDANEKPDMRAFRSVMRNLDARESTKSAMENLSQILNKIPTCLFETFDGIVHQNLKDPTFFIDIFCAELMQLIDRLHMNRLSKDLMGFIACVLLDVRELYEIAGYFRAEEFLFFVRNKFLSDLEGVFVFVTFYLEFGHAQLDTLNTGGYFVRDMPNMLQSIVEKLDNDKATRPREVFEFLLAAKPCTTLLLPNYDCV